MHCHLLIPDLFWPEPGADAFNNLPLPALQRLLSRARHHTRDAESMEGWLCDLFGVVRQRDWPVAPLTLAADGGDPGSRYWLRADPVHLAVRGVELILAPPGVLDVTRAEAEALTATLNRHFRDDQLCFQALAPDRWYLGLDFAPELHSYAPAQAVGRNIESFLPEGAESARWRSVFNEVQMLLHEHPINSAREARGELPVNSVWFWGGGVKPARLAMPVDFVCSDQALTRSLGQASGAAVLPAPKLAAHWLRSAGASGAHLLELDALTHALMRADLSAWRSQLAAYEADWFSPLLGALRTGKLGRFELTTIAHRTAQDFIIERADLWKFWRPRIALSSYR